MIVGNLAIFFNMLSILVLTALSMIFVVSIIIKFRLNALAQYSILSRRRALWILALSPWIIGLFAAILAVTSGTQFSPLPNSYNFLHWHHAQEFNFKSWHGLSMITAATYICLIVASKLYRLVQNSQQINSLRAFSEVDDSGFYQLESDAATAFTAGYVNPKCYITSALRLELTTDEFQVLQLHEREHARRSDPFKKWFYQLSTALFPRYISQKLNLSMALVMEQCADQAIANVIQDKSFIAMTLLKVNRLASRSFKGVLNNESFCYYAVNNIEQRINYLLTEQQSKLFSLYSVLLAVVSVTLMCALSADFFHHFIESTLSH